MTSVPRHGPAGPRLRRPALYLLLSFYSVLSLAAFLWVTIQALKSNSEFVSTLPWTLPREPRWQNFADAWDRAQIGRYVLNSILVGVGSTIGALALSTLSAYALARIRGVAAARWVEQAFLSGLMLPSLLTVVPLYFLWVDLKLANTLAGIIIIYAGLMQPFSIFFLTGYFRAIPSELEEAAVVDGASPFEAFARVFLPVAQPGLVAVFVVNFLWAWNEFYYALIFLSRNDLFTVPLGLFGLQVNAEYAAQWTPLFAGMLINVVPVLVLYLFLSEQVTRGLTSGAVKG